MPDPLSRPIRVWDLPTRFFHWALALTIVDSVASADGWPQRLLALALLALCAGIVTRVVNLGS